MAAAAPQVVALASTSPASTHAAEQAPQLLKTLVVSGISVSTASCCTNPIDVVKTRLQLQHRQAGPAAGPRLGMSQLMVQIVRAEGVGALWKGIAPACARGLTYGGLRLGLYEPVKDGMQSALSTAGYTPDILGTSGTLAVKVTAGVAAGGTAAAVTSPMELIKTRMQAAASGRVGAFHVVRDVVAAHSVAGLWRGAVPGIVRAAMLNAGQCATYDVTKREIMRQTGWPDHAGTQVACALVTGLVTTTVSNPADMVKTVMFVGGGKQQGAWEATKTLVLAEGPSVLMRGWLANYTRLGPQTLVTFLVAERLRSLVGLHSL